MQSLKRLDLAPGNPRSLLALRPLYKNHGWTVDMLNVNKLGPSRSNISGSFVDELLFSRLLTVIPVRVCFSSFGRGNVIAYLHRSHGRAAAG